MSIPLPVLRYLTALAIAVVLAVLLILAVVVALRGGPNSTGQLVSLLGAFGTLVGILVSLLTSRQLVNLADDIQSKVNGHLEQHLGHTDAQVAELVDRRLQEQGLREQQS